MKTNKIILAGLMAVGMFFAACTEETPTYQPAQPETNEIQAYVYNNTVTAYQFVKLEETFPVVIGRNATKDAASFTVAHNDTVGAFTFNPEVSFEAGVAVDTLWITANLSYGESYDLTLAIPEEYTTAYGTAAVTISVVVDFTWLPMGTVKFASQWEGAEATVEIEMAKEYSDAAGNSLYRLNSPYYYVSPTYCTVEGLHLQFLLDKDYNAVSLTAEGFIEVENTGYNWMYWVPQQYPDYCFFINQANVYAVGTLWTDGAKLYGPVVEQWAWVDGYPGELPADEPTDEPAEGEEEGAEE